MFFGLRLVFSVALSTPILGSTIIQTGVQVWLCDRWWADACLRCSCWVVRGKQSIISLRTRRLVGRCWLL